MTADLLAKSSLLAPPSSRELPAVVPANQSEAARAKDAGSSKSVLILTPVFNDWKAAGLLLPQIDAALAIEGIEAELLIVDDGSTETRPTGWLSDAQAEALRAVRRIEVLELARNCGHQRAIAIGLAWIREHRPGVTVVICDSDGEDDPRDIPRLLARYEAEGRGKIVFAARARRSENWRFQLGYRVYQLLHWTLTGQRVRVGNFSVLPPRAVERLSVVSETWNHYAAAVFTSRIRYEMAPTARATRLDGESRMNFTALVLHGLSALSVFSHIIAVRLLIANCLLIVCTLLGLAAGWWWGAAGNLGGSPLSLALGLLLLAGLVQGTVVGAAFALLVLSGRQGTSFIPIRDYGYFVTQASCLYERP